MTEGGSEEGSGKTDRRRKKIIIRRKAEQAGLPPASPSPVGCVGEWAVKEGVQ